MTPDQIADLPTTVPAVLIVDLAALRSNYETLRDRAEGAECAAVVKANAYGLGLQEAIPTLTEAGCTTFFVATVAEGRTVRKLAPAADIYVLGGLLKGAQEQFTQANLKPVLGSLDELREWASAGAPAALHADTGMNRLGLQPANVDALTRQPELVANANIDLFMTHLACGDDRNSDMNKRQLVEFASAKQKLGIGRSSIANSAGILLGDGFHQHLVRPGIALYGGEAINDEPNPMKPVVTLYAQILQVRDLESGAPIGYGSTFTTSRTSRIATIGVGYADGMFRSLSSSNKQPDAKMFINGQPAPIVGRVSMDLITIDITDIPEAKRGTWVEVIGKQNTVDDIARRAGSIGYEVLTRLGPRFHRIYKKGD